ncbi:ATP-binding protein [Halothiobacillus sp. DCM-1]|uniref:ATP-binding protein n=1 Tax=Halothiobacillus sp. DCM-1 TaxID=3112558 RepID=UPI003247DC94
MLAAPNPTRQTKFFLRHQRPTVIHPNPLPLAIAQRWDPQHGFRRIHHPALVDPLELLHRDRQIHQLRRNTQLFLSGQPANHALLWGARGTGKSSVIRAMLSEFGGAQLGMVELERPALQNLGDLTQILGDQPQRRFILFVDDLSFEVGDPSYKALKALLDGSLMAPPDNVLVYASSNRRHLLPETMHDNLGAQIVEGELHEGDAIDEKISLSERFGLWLSFHPFTQQQYLDIVAHQLQHLLTQGVTNQTLHDRAAWEPAAVQFARLRGSRSGRVAQQFVRYWQSEHLAS